jgi:tetratricopeptide (TPR) repeat protein
MIKEAIEVFKLNIKAYPESFNVYDSLGEAFMISGDKELAIENYEKSLVINPDNKNAVKMLKKLDENIKND